MSSKDFVVALGDQVARPQPEAGVAAPPSTRELLTALKRVVEAAERALGDHTAPFDCYATGPLTGNPIADFVACPGCAQVAEIEAARAVIAGADGRHHHDHLINGIAGAPLNIPSKAPAHSELEPDDHTREASRSPSQQGGGGREAGRRDEAFAGGPQCGQRRTGPCESQQAPEVASGEPGDSALLSSGHPNAIAKASGQ